MVAIFTARKELQQLAAEKAAGPNAFPDQHLYPAAQFKGAAKYVGRMRVTMPAPGGPITFELLDGTYAAAGIVATDEIFVETDSQWIGGAWTVGVVTDPSALAVPLDPPAQIEIVQVDPENTSGSHATVAPNRVRGAIDVTVDVRISDAITLTTNNLRTRGTLGFSRSSDNMRQLTFQGVVTGDWIIGDTVTGGTSGATGTIVGLGPGINQGLGPDAFGFFLMVDMGVDYAGAEFDDATPDVITATTTGASGTLKSGDLGERSTGILFRPQHGSNPAYTSGLGTKLFATSGFLEFYDGNKIEFPNAFVDQANGIYPGDSVLFDDPPIAGQVFSVVGLANGPSGVPGGRNSIVVDPPHGVSGGHSQSPVTILYAGPAKVQETLLALAVDYDGTSPGTLNIEATDGRTWSGIGVQLGDIIRTKNSANGNNFDLRAANFLTATNPNDRLFLPGDSHLPFVGPYPETVDVYKLS